MEKKIRRLKRAKRARKHIQTLGATRVSVHRTLKHIYAQVITPEGAVMVSASTLEKKLNCKNGGNVEAARLIGKVLAERAKSAGIVNVAFDRSGFKYHGRVKALAEAAREHGLVF